MMLLALLGCGLPGNVVHPHGDVGWSFDAVRTALWWELDDTAAVLTLSAEPFDCDALRSGGGEEAAAQGPTLSVQFVPEAGAGWEATYVSGQQPWSGPWSTETAPVGPTFWTVLQHGADFEDLSGELGTAIVEHLDDARAVGTVDTVSLDARFRAEVCPAGRTDTGTDTTEVCNGRDDDLDGEIDEGLLVTRYLDGDGDGYGVSEVEVCPEDTAGYADDGGDCNDDDPGVYPGRAEECDGDDDDCDAIIDEGAC